MSKIDYSYLIGVPFKNGGRSMEGMDCYGIAMEVFRHEGKEIGEYWSDAYDVDRINRIYRREIKKWRKVDYKNGEEIPVPALIGIRFNSPPGIVNHTGVYIGDGQFIHIRERIGVCVDRIDSPVWRSKIEGIYEFVGGKESG
ncbi:C40 family peptidase [Phascolarctobacterium sp.]|uniref:C40 family peptidase n=1 Tax=Phascolarctobacterium sp. TaxID=2049039 RepID=UPI003863B304